MEKPIKKLSITELDREQMGDIWKALFAEKEEDK